MPLAILLSYPRPRLGSLWRNELLRFCLPTTTRFGALPQIRTFIRLIKSEEDGDLTLVEHDDNKTPQYAILSHTWGADGEEVTFKDLTEGRGKNKAGWRKIEFCRAQAARDGLKHFWVDTCCIDKSSSAELTEAINSMFHFYRKADKCYAYLSDVSTSAHDTNAQSSPTIWEVAFRKSRWFTRGWTLQELVAPLSVEFFSREGDQLGSKKSLEQDIHDVTGIAIEALRGAPLTEFKIEERFSWVDHRATKRQEDKAYSLLGLFDIHMPLLYGEGEEKAFTRLREEIRKSSKSSVEPPKALMSPSSTVPFRRDIDFVDRGTLYNHGTVLEQIDQRFATAASRVALVGIGGSGKSQLAIEHCHRLRERSPNTWVFWIHANNIDRIEQGYREIAERLKIPHRKDPKQNIFELVARWLRDESKGTWLLVLDNLDDSAILAAPPAAAPRPRSSDSGGQLRRPLLAYLPQSQNGKILVTTRTRSVATKLVERRDIIAIDCMTKTDAVVLLQKKLDGSANKQDLEELVSLLEYMPLAIVQAAAYIQQKGARYSVRQYIEAFQKNEKQQISLLNHEAGHLRRDSEAKNSIIITWQISFDEIRKKWPLSANLLSLMSYFDRQGIPEEMLQVQPREEEIRDSTMQKSDLACDVGKDEDQDVENDGVFEANSDDVFEEAVDHLLSYSLVSVGEDRWTFVMHGLVQLATRKWLEMQGEEEKWKGQFSQNLNAVFPNGEHENWGLCEILFPHAKSAERQRPTESRSVQKWAQILRKAGWYAWAKGDYREAERMCEQSVEALTKVLGREDVETSFSLGLLASIYSDQGRWTEAEKIGMQVMEIRKRVLGEEHPNTLTSMANLALKYRNQERWSEAEKIGLQVIETSRRVLGEEHPLTLTSTNNLASIYGNQGRWIEAEKIGVQVMETRKRVLGEEHPSTLTSMNNLALTYGNQGRWMEAEKIGLQVTETSRRVLGEEHPSTLTSINNLASIYGNQGRWSEAEKIGLQVTETIRRVLGEEHPSTLTSMNNLALTYGNQGRWMEAEKIGLQVTETSQRVLGEEHPSTLTSTNNLASIYGNQGRWTEAEKIGLQVIETSRRVLGEEHPSTLTSMNILVLTYWNQGRWTEAEKIGLQVIEISRRVLGEEHPSTLTNMNNLALTYGNQGRWMEAEKIGLQVTEISRRVLGEEHPDTLTTMNNLVLTYGNQGRWTEAEKIGVQVMETRKRVQGEEHPDTLTSINNLASIYGNQGRWIEAEKIGVQVMETRKRVLGEEHPSTLTSMNNLALTYGNQGRWMEAEKIGLQVTETSRRVLGEEHPSTLTSINNLASIYGNQGRWSEAEKIGLQVTEISRRVLGEEHPDTLTTMNNLVLTYGNQGRWTEAEKIGVQVMETRKRVQGEEHPDTLTSMNNLACTMKEQGGKLEAMKLMAGCVHLRSRVLGSEHPQTLSSVATLAEWQSVD